MIMRHQLQNLRNRKMAAAGVICLLLIIFMVVYRVSEQQAGGPKKQELTQVEVYRLQRGDLSRHISLAGQTVADAAITLSPKYAGRVAAVNVELGDRVTKGQILLVQDTEDLDIAIGQARAEAEAAGADVVTTQAGYYAEYLRAEAAYDIHKRHYERQQYLYSIGAISQNTLDSARDLYVSAKAAYDSMANQSEGGGSPASVRSKELAAAKSRYNVRALEKQRSDMFIRAPRDGIISYRDVEAGSYIAAGARVLTLVDTSRIYVDCSLSENDAAVLEPGMDVEVTIDALGKTYAGRLVFVSPAMGDDSKAFMARIALEDSGTEIKSGLFARSAVDILQKKDTLFVPKEAVMTKNGRTLVYTLAYVYDDNTFVVRERQVALGLMNDAEAEIVDGLQEGDLVVIAGQDRLQPDMAVRVKNPEAASQQPAAGQEAEDRAKPAGEAEGQ